MMLAVFYVVHRASKLCCAVICNKPCDVTCLVTKVSKHGRQTFVAVKFNQNFSIIKSFIIAFIEENIRSE